MLLAAAVWLRQLLNEERAKAWEPPARHDNVLRATRTAREKLGAVSLLNFEERKYVDIRGKTQPLILFSVDVLLNVAAEVGGKVEHQLLHRANVEFNPLKKMERSGGAADFMPLMHTMQEDRGAGGIWGQGQISL